MKRLMVGVVLSLLCIVGLMGCSGNDTEVRVVASKAMVESELFDALAQRFSQSTGLGVKATALEEEALAEKIASSNFDAALVKSNAEIRSRLSEGTLKGALVFYDTLYLIGPQSDPAGIGQFQDKSCADLFRHIALTKSRFVYSPALGVLRLKEQAIWEAAEITPDGDWYIAAQGEGEDVLLKAASQNRAYTVVDRETYEAYHQSYPDLVILQKGIDDLSDNYYCLYEKEESDPTPAQQFCQWMQSEEAQGIIAQYQADGKSRYQPANTLTQETAEE